MSRSVDIVVSKDVLRKLSENDRYSLAALAEHPSGAIRVVENLSAVNGATILAEVERAQGWVAWACSDANAAIGSKGWGQASAPLIVGMKAATEAGEVWSASSLRPSAITQGDVEISVQHQLNGDLKTFGQRFWNLVRQLHPASNKILENSNAKLTSITYSDRYLFTPLSVALVLQVVDGLNHAIGAERFGKPELFIRTTGVRQERAEIAWRQGVF